ncbi:hypothetical protein [Bradyrhizobium archetypum]|uniref:Uncharacterized protein n=1 Tax=Bradyrhizobium archetypum TaxID=2721160 RepID=A0A7Y4M5L6_9BRAD|nr:hypothetical protein [Bradyrhizobium archetypum]NOJ50699.1 hypothetical protein [Bradyrhizobium archetypum]
MVAGVKKKSDSPSRYRKPNALKHGGFSRMELFPWENSAEFEKLHRDLIDQYQPRGPLQEDCIQSVASFMWRKRRIRDKRRFDTQAALERVENAVLWDQPPPLMDKNQEITMYRLTNGSSELRPHALDDYQRLMAFSCALYRDRSKSSVSMIVDFLPKEFKEHLKEKVPGDAYETATQWIVALKEEVDGVLLPMVRKRQPKSDCYAETAANFLTNERLMADLDIEERFDAGIDRALKRLFSLKAAEQLDRPRVVESKPPPRLQQTLSAEEQ